MVLLWVGEGKVAAWDDIDLRSPIPVASRRGSPAETLMLKKLNVPGREKRYGKRRHLYTITYVSIRLLRADLISPLDSDPPIRLSWEV